MQTVAIGRVGDDFEGGQLLQLLEQDKVDVSGIVIDPSFRTPLKCRMIADTQQLLRIDYETISPLLQNLKKRFSIITAHF